MFNISNYCKMLLFSENCFPDSINEYDINFHALKGIRDELRNYTKY